MSQTDGGVAEPALRRAEDEERHWYGRMVGMSLISCGASLVLGPGVVAGDARGPAPLWTAAGFGLPFAGWLVAKIIVRSGRPRR